MKDDLITYYHERAKEYERIYSKPERQEDIKAAAEILQELFRNKEVLEIACGTGFWTEYMAETAKSIVATDVNLAVIEIAQQKKILNPHVVFEVKNFYEFDTNKKYQSLFGGFIWSHIPKQDLRTFFTTINRLVAKDGTVVLMDNSYVEGSNHPITDTDEQGNTFQTRKLDDGSVHKVLKNFATETSLKEILKDLAMEVRFIQLNYFWILSYVPNTI